MLTPIGEIIRAQLGGGFAGLHLLIYGVLLTSVILWFPKGLNPLVMKIIKGIGNPVGQRRPTGRFIEGVKARKTNSARGNVILEINSLTKRFGGLVAVKDISFKLQEARIFGLIGPNGAGKTTLFNLIAGYYKPDAGRVIYQGKDITGHKPYEICGRGIGRTFQVTMPFLDCTVLYNVMVGGLLQSRRASGAQDIAWEVLEMLNFANRAGAMGYELNIVDRKRLEIARAIATGAKMLLLDEPAAGLTPSEKGQMIELLRRINQQGFTLVIVEHDMKVVMSLCNHIILMNRGMKLVEGTPKDVCSEPKAIAAYLGEEYAART